MALHITPFSALERRTGSINGIESDTVVPLVHYERASLGMISFRPVALECFSDGNHLMFINTECGIPLTLYIAHSNFGVVGGYGCVFTQPDWWSDGLYAK